MLNPTLKRVLALTALTGTLSLTNCNYFENYLPENSNARLASTARLKDQSVTPALLKKMPGFEGVQVYSIISSDDKLPQSPEFVFGGSADGAGWLRDEKGQGYVYVTNHEDNFAVSRINFNEALKPLKGEYILNSDGGQWRLCSATLATPQEHGFGPLFITCGESSVESRTHALNPFAPVSSQQTSREKPALGRWNAENAVPLPKYAYDGKTVIILGDDDSGSGGGQIAMYVSDQGDLDNGTVYVLRRLNKNQREMDLTVNNSYEVEFVKIENAKDLTGAQMNSKVNEVQAIKFGRVEDIDYRKGNDGREIYFNVTGQNNTGNNADYSRSKYGRVYKLMLDAKDPLKGTLSVVLNGDDREGKAKLFQNPDNIMVTNNYAYIKEDPNGYGDETHDSYVYQYNLSTGELKVVFELDHRRNAADAAKYNVGGLSSFGDWEYGAMLDMSEVTGMPDIFSLNIQPHTWRGEEYRNPDGGSVRPNENQASQMVIIQGLPR